MQNLHMLLAGNVYPDTRRRVRLYNRSHVFIYGRDQLDFIGLKRIMMFISSIRTRYNEMRVPLHFDMGTIKSIDKLSITLLECIMYSLVVELHYKVTMTFNVQHTIFTECIKHSPLRDLGPNFRFNMEAFKKRFRHDLTINHYRTIVPEDAVYDERLSRITNDIQYFFSHGFIGKQYCDKLSEVVSELISNATEHGQASCLVDIDISQEYTKPNDDGEYRGINISLVSFSNVSFQEKLQEKLSDKSCHTGRYASVVSAYESHTKYFNNDYTPDDFYRIAAYQDKISGRYGETSSGGTGLTCLLHSVEQMSDADLCYMLSQSRILRFPKSVLDYDEDGWVGFNNFHDFINYPPDPNILQSSPIFMPGVAYNLNFAYKKENDQ